MSVDGTTRTQEDRNFLDDILALQRDRPPSIDLISEYYASDFAHVPERLRNLVPMQTFDLPLDICEDVHNVICPAARHYGTMVAAAKSFVMIPPDDPSHYVQPYEGAPFAFVDRWALPAPAHARARPR